MHAALYDASTQTLLTVEPGNEGITIVVRGKRALWSDMIESAYAWEDLGRPGKASTTWQLDQRGQQSIRIEHQGKTRTVAFIPSASFQ